MSIVVYCVDVSVSSSLSATSAGTHCLRICSYTIKHSSSSSRGPIIRESHLQQSNVIIVDEGVEGDTLDRVRMLNTAFAAMTKVMSTLQSSQREDIRGVAIMLYTGKLGKAGCVAVYLLQQNY